MDSRICCVRLLALASFGFGLADCGGSDKDATQFTLGGTVSGLSGTGLTLRNGTDSVEVSGNGAFTFANKVASGQSYSVSVPQQPSAPSQTCRVAGGSGTVSDVNVTSVEVTCTTNSFHLHGAVTGLSGDGLTLHEAGAGDVAITSDGAFAFPQALESGTSYVISVSAQPQDPAQMCNVVHGSGTVGEEDIANVSITCQSSLNASNAGAIAAVGNHATETLLQFASFIGERLRFLAGHEVTQPETCTAPFAPSQGSASYTLTDADQDGAPSAGDTVRIDLSECVTGSLGDTVTGTLVLTLYSPPDPQHYDQEFSATTTLDAFPLLGTELTGTLKAVVGHSDTSHFVQADVDSGNFIVHYTGAGFNAADTVTLHDVAASKRIDYTTAQYVTQLEARYRSETLGGEFILTTPIPLSGRLNTYPVTGEEEFSAGWSVLRLSAVNVADNDYPLATLDVDGTGDFQSDPLLHPFWGETLMGFPWWEPHANAGIQASPTYHPTRRDEWAMSILFAEPLADPVNGILGINLNVEAPIRMYFAGPIDGTRSGLIYIPSGYDDTSPYAIPADLEIQGAMMTVRPHTPLEHGVEYRLSTPDGIYSIGDVGASRPVGFTLTTANNLFAAGEPSPGVAERGATVSLLAGGSYSEGSAMAGYAWQQVSGTPVTLVNAATPQATFVVPAGALDDEQLVFRLTVTNATGETDSIETHVHVLYDLTQPFLFFRRAPRGPFDPELSTLLTAADGALYTILELDPNLSEFQLNVTGSSISGGLRLIAPPGQSLVPGSYSSTDPVHVSLPIQVSPLDSNCGVPDVWQYAVYESVRALDGSAAQFSADFSFQCESEPPVSGSVRVASTRFLP